MAYEILGVKLFTVKESAEVLKMSTKDVKRLLREDILCGGKIGTSWFVPEPSLKAFKFVEGERQKLQGEALCLKYILNDFLKAGDISQDYYDQAVKRLGGFLQLD
ncbi:helix-turn-helix domain-containing protein [bacterium]|nr:helix-turn-helix domain-containing protein [bacterium]